MQKIVKENLKLERKEVSRQDALDMFAAAGETYKVELINDLPEDALITLYTQGPHLCPAQKAARRAGLRSQPQPHR